MMEYGKNRAEQISLFGCSMGAYFSLLAYKDTKIHHAWFLSPVVDMGRIIRNMMEQSGITEEELRDRKVIDHPIEPLSWDYYCYVNMGLFPHLQRDFTVGWRSRKAGNTGSIRWKNWNFIENGCRLNYKRKFSAKDIMHFSKAVHNRMNEKKEEQNGTSDNKRRV